MIIVRCRVKYPFGNLKIIAIIHKKVTWAIRSRLEHAVIPPGYYLFSFFDRRGGRGYSFTVFGHHDPFPVLQDTQWWVDNRGSLNKIHWGSIVLGVLGTAGRRLFGVFFSPCTIYNGSASIVKWELINRLVLVDHFDWSSRSSVCYRKGSGVPMRADSYDWGCLIASYKMALTEWSTVCI